MKTDGQEPDVGETKRFLRAVLAIKKDVGAIRRLLTEIRVGQQYLERAVKENTQVFVFSKWELDAYVREKVAAAKAKSVSK